jgi:hypothetical protein
MRVVFERLNNPTVEKIEQSLELFGSALERNNENQGFIM